MHLRPDEPLQIARLFKFLQHGECLARDVAAQQAHFADTSAWQRFFTTQARQEAFHATVFQGAICWLAPQGVGSTPGLTGLGRYRTLAEASLGNGDLAESALAMQVLFEALGDVVLEAIDHGITRRGGGFERLRRVLRAQEQAHHAFGVRLLSDLAPTTASQERLRQRAQRYMELISEMFSELDGLFAAFGEDPADYLAGFRHRLPVWLASA